MISSLGNVPSAIKLFLLFTKIISNEENPNLASVLAKGKSELGGHSSISGSSSVTQSTQYQQICLIEHGKGPTK